MNTEQYQNQIENTTKLKQIKPKTQHEIARKFNKIDPEP